MDETFAAAAMQKMRELEAGNAAKDREIARLKKIIEQLHERGQHADSWDTLTDAWLRRRLKPRWLCEAR